MPPAKRSRPAADPASDWRARLGATPVPPRPAARGGEWTADERRVLDRLTTPARIQDFLDRLRYRTDDEARCPRQVLRDRQAHCYDGALVAAAALRRIGHPPLLLDLWAVRDDDHVLALFRVDGHFGAVSKSNFAGLRFREPIFRSLRELVLSYFEDYYNTDAEKTLRAYSRPLDLRRFDGLGWMFHDEPVPYISDRLDALDHLPLLTGRMERSLSPVDPRSLRAGMVGTRADGIYRKP